VVIIFCHRPTQKHTAIFLAFLGESRFFKELQIKINKRDTFMNDFSELLELAVHLGAGDAVLINAADIVVKDELAKMCFEPRCEGYGNSLSCPPLVRGPEAFRKFQPEYENALVFKLEVPMDVAMTLERNEVLALIHEISARVEAAARKQGFERAKAFAGGSCKALFCADYPECRVLDEKKPCRNPHIARESMSGYGIDVTKLMTTAGWEQQRWDKNNKENATVTFAGMVLLD
jgi:predicted metal-binding protein